MTQPQTPPEGEAHDGTTPEVAPAQARTDLNTLPQDVIDYIRELRQEARKANDAKKEAKTEQERQERERLEKQQEWEALAQQYKQKLDELTPRAELADALEQRFKDMAQTRIEKLPKQFRNLLDLNDPVKALEWLDANESILTTPVPPNLDAGRRGDDTKVTPKLTPEARRAAEVAKAYGYNLTPEQIAARQTQIEQARQQPPEQDT